MVLLSLGSAIGHIAEVFMWQSSTVGHTVESGPAIGHVAEGFIWQSSTVVQTVEFGVQQ